MRQQQEQVLLLVQRQPMGLRGPPQREPQLAQEQLQPLLLQAQELGLEPRLLSHLLVQEVEPQQLELGTGLGLDQRVPTPRQE